MVLKYYIVTYKFTVRSNTRRDALSDIEEHFDENIPPYKVKEIEEA